MTRGRFAVQQAHRLAVSPQPHPAQGAGGVYEALIDVPSRVFDVDFAAQLSACGATDTLRHVIITRLTPERLPVLAAVLRTCRQRGIQLSLTNPALQLLNDRAAADETLAQVRGCRWEAHPWHLLLARGGGAGGKQRASLECCTLQQYKKRSGAQSTA